MCPILTKFSVVPIQPPSSLPVSSQSPTTPLLEGRKHREAGHRNPSLLAFSRKYEVLMKENSNFSISPGGGLRKMAVPGQLAREFQG